MPKYVGNRCIPMPMGNWDKNKEYENLSVVLASNGDSYTSKKNVPKGIELSNTEYWAISGNYNAQVENYREETKKVENELNSFKTSFETFALYFGNSYSLGVGSTDGQGIYKLTKTLYNNAKLYAGSGTGFIDYGSHADDTFLTWLTNAINDTSYDHNKVTHINVIGAWGESRAMAKLGYSEFIKQTSASMTNFANRVKANFPNCKEINYIWCEVRNFFSQTAYDINNTYRASWLVNKAMPICCSLTGFNYLGWAGWNSNFTTENFSNDNYHPNNTGYARISNDVKQSLNRNLNYMLYISDVEVAFTDYPNVKLTGRITSNTETPILTLNGITCENNTKLPNTEIKVPIFSTLYNNSNTNLDSHFHVPILPGSRSLRVCTTLGSKTEGELDLNAVILKSYYTNENDIGISFKFSLATPTNVTGFIPLGISIPLFNF